MSDDGLLVWYKLNNFLRVAAMLSLSRDSRMTPEAGGEGMRPKLLPFFLSKKLFGRAMLRVFQFTRSTGKAGGAGGRLALLPGRGVSPQPLFSFAAEGGRRGKTDTLKSPVVKTITAF